MLAGRILERACDLFRCSDSSIFSERFHFKYPLACNGRRASRDSILRGLKLVKSGWLLRRLAFSFDPNVKVFQVKRENEFSEVYMESVAKNLIMDETDQKPKVGLMVMPGFCIVGSVIHSRVHLSGMKVNE